jgi:hypothetical protein
MTKIQNSKRDCYEKSANPVTPANAGVQNLLKLLESAKALLRARLCRLCRNCKNNTYCSFVIPGLTRNPVFLGCYAAGCRIKSGMTGGN